MGLVGGHASRPLNLVVPFNLKFGHSGLLDEDVPGEFGDVGLRGRVLVEFLLLVEVVHVVAHAEELLAVVGASQQQGGDSHDIVFRQARVVGGVSLERRLRLRGEGAYLELELHLAGHDVFHFRFLEDLVEHGVGGLPNVHNAPGEG